MPEKTGVNFELFLFITQPIQLVPMSKALALMDYKSCLD